MNQELLLPALATMIALSVYFSQSIFVGSVRAKYNVKAPKVTGNEDFERVFRVHYNTLESLPVFLVSMWFFALLVSPFYAGILGMLWSVGKIGYMYGYYKSAEKRHAYGSVLSYVALMPLFPGPFYAIISGLIK
jgi:glutathione S-transferase